MQTKLDLFLTKKIARKFKIPIFLFLFRISLPRNVNYLFWHHCTLKLSFSSRAKEGGLIGRRNRQPREGEETPYRTSSVGSVLRPSKIGPQIGSLFFLLRSQVRGGRVLAGIRGAGGPSTHDDPKGYRAPSDYFRVFICSPHAMVCAKKYLGLFSRPIFCFFPPIFIACFFGDVVPPLGFRLLFPSAPSPLLFSFHFHSIHSGHLSPFLFLPTRHFLFIT